jgi:hypothetical protein
VFDIALFLNAFAVGFKGKRHCPRLALNFKMGPGFEQFKPEPEFQATVIVLNYNGRQWLKRCLDSIKNQTVFKDLGIIVADNDSH